MYNYDDFNELKAQTNIYSVPPLLQLGIFLQETF